MVYHLERIDGDRHSHLSWFMMAPYKSPPFGSGDRHLLLPQCKCIGKSSSPIRRSHLGICAMVKSRDFLGINSSHLLIGILISWVFINPYKNWVDFPIPKHIWKCHGINGCFWFPYKVGSVAFFTPQVRQGL